MSLTQKWQSWTPYFLSILRIIAGYVFLQYGSTKMLAFPVAIMPDGGTAKLGTMAGTAGLLELVGGILIMVGLFTRPTAFVLSGLMAFAYFMGHANKTFWEGLWPVVNQGAPAVIFCFLFLYYSAAGAGPWSLDALFARSKSASPAE